MELSPIKMFENHEKKNHIIFLKDNVSGRRFGVYLAKFKGEDHPIVIDADDFVLQGPNYTIYIHPSGCPYINTSNTTCKKHHSLIFGKIPQGQTIEHMNWIKTDNRRANLRSVTLSEPTENRSARCDMNAPLEELQELGITHYPRGIRWEPSESKFRIELNDVAISSTKSTKVSTINKFRDILKKYITVSEPESTRLYFISERYKLAEEYNQILKAAHQFDPEFPDGPYVDAANLMDKCNYAKELLDKLPAVEATDILHGPLTQQQGHFHIPEISAFAIRKGDNVIIFDNIYEKIIRALPNIDFSGGSPMIPASTTLQSMFPNAISQLDVKAKKKILVKELVWRGFFNKELIPDHTIVPINYQQTDLRAENLRLLPGGPKSYKGIVKFKVPDEALMDDRFFPNGISLNQGSASKVNPWSLYYKTPSMEKRKNILCSPLNIQEAYNKAKAIFAKELPNFEEDNVIFQRLVSEYDQYVAPL